MVQIYKKECDDPKCLNNSQTYFAVSVRIRDFEHILRSNPARKRAKNNRTNKLSLFIRLIIKYLSLIETLSILPR